MNQKTTDELDLILTPERDFENDRKITEQCWHTGSLTYKFTKSQKLIYETFKTLPRGGDITFRAMECARGFGKSYYVALDAIMETIKPPHRYPVFLLAPKLDQCVKIFTPIIQWLCQDAPDGFVRQLRASNEWRIGNNQLILGGFERGWINGLRGQRAKKMAVDEARDCDSENLIYGLRQVMASMVAHAEGPIDVISSTPDQMDHSFLTEIIPEAQAFGAYVQKTIDENETLTDAQKAKLIRDLGGIHSDGAQRELWCKRIRSTNQVLCPDFIKARHVKLSEIPKDALRQVWTDWGGVRDKTVFHVVAYDYKRNRIVFEDEVAFSSNTKTSLIVEGAVKLEESLKERGYKTKPDRFADAPGQVIVDLRDEHGYEMTKVMNPIFTENLQYVNTMFFEDLIEISPKCNLLVATLEHGKLDKHRKDFERTDALGHCDAAANAFVAIRNMPFYVPPSSKTAEDHENDFMKELDHEPKSRDDEADIGHW